MHNENRGKQATHNESESTMARRTVSELCDAVKEVIIQGSPWSCGDAWVSGEHNDPSDAEKHEFRTMLQAYIRGAFANATIILKTESCENVAWCDGKANPTHTNRVARECIKAAWSRWSKDAAERAECKARGILPRSMSI